MAQDPWQLTGAGPESYKRYQVPSVFGPLARILVRHAALRPGQRVLDLACGTGVVAQEAASLLGRAGSIVGLDLNAGMLEIACRHAPAGGATVEWRQGDAGALPLSNADFDAVLCQQGLQFFPDRPAALRESHRVLRPGGLAAFCVWRGIEHSPCHSAVVAALRRHASDDVAHRFQAPFGFGDGAALERLLREVGFREVEVRVEALERRLLPPEESIPGLLASTPVGPEVAALPESARRAIVAEVAAALARYRDGDGFVIPQPTHVAVARN
ncbi:hypothetical protein GCM10011504_48740 [Siccirubricoccus deserti]|uniref:Methyltransferase domain-containing protein n=1 Tax=Siccirubricoccus deserti TaxID=2013562 RepID=A0A9X0R4L0_9PROT|nr:methyltransferase domain-containing protein [Siccirubricoccus deserti]MBC4018272.1 methyltransferase domain-containing protein [Siccirubricoccus deserti]GGC64935.1 hypothetical protein GCM10011504_48740 [Siccirubricoccus deserti]